jgi:hypothetical protein
MNPNEITTSARTGHSVRRPKVFAMYWRLTVIVVIAFSILICVTFAMFKLLYPHGMTAQHLYNDVAFAIAFLFALIGSGKIKRAGYKKYTLYHLLCSFIFTIALIVIPFPKSVRHVVLEYGIYLFYVLIAGLFPLSLYLKYKQKKSSTESTIADAN